MWSIYIIGEASILAKLILPTLLRVPQENRWSDVHHINCILSSMLYVCNWLCITFVRTSSLFCCFSLSTNFDHQVFLAVVPKLPPPFLFVARSQGSGQVSADPQSFPTSSQCALIVYSVSPCRRCDCGCNSNWWRLDGRACAAHRPIRHATFQLCRENVTGIICWFENI